jgi:hypothetical protein
MTEDGTSKGSAINSGEMLDVIGSRVAKNKG